MDHMFNNTAKQRINFQDIQNLLEQNTQSCVNKNSKQFNFNKNQDCNNGNQQELAYQQLQQGIKNNSNSNNNNFNQNLFNDENNNDQQEINYKQMLYQQEMYLKMVEEQQRQELQRTQEQKIQIKDLLNMAQQQQQQGPQNEIYEQQTNNQRFKVTPKNINNGNNFFQSKKVSGASSASKYSYQQQQQQQIQQFNSNVNNDTKRSLSNQRNVSNQKVQINNYAKNNYNQTLNNINLTLSEINNFQQQQQPGNIVHCQTPTINNLNLDVNTVNIDAIRNNINNHVWNNQSQTTKNSSNQVFNFQKQIQQKIQKQHYENQNNNNNVQYFQQQKQQQSQISKRKYQDSKSLTKNNNFMNNNNTNLIGNNENSNKENQKTPQNQEIYSNNYSKRSTSSNVYNKNKNLNLKNLDLNENSNILQNNNNYQNQQQYQNEKVYDESVEEAKKGLQELLKKHNKFAHGLQMHTTKENKKIEFNNVNNGNTLQQNNNNDQKNIIQHQYQNLTCDNKHKKHFVFDNKIAKQNSDQDKFNNTETLNQALKTEGNSKIKKNLYLDDQLITTKKQNTEKNTKLRSSTYNNPNSNNNKNVNINLYNLMQKVQQQQEQTKTSSNNTSNKIKNTNDKPIKNQTQDFSSKQNTQKLNLKQINKEDFCQTTNAVGGNFDNQVEYSVNELEKEKAKDLSDQIWFLNNDEKCCQPDKFLAAMEGEKDRKFENISMNQRELEQKEDKTSKFKQEYLVGKQIGQGAYASVRIALHKPTNKKVAIKIYEKAKIKDPQRKKSVRREIKLLQKLNNRNVIRILDTVETNNHVNIITEYIGGSSVHDFLKKKQGKKLDEQEASRIFKDLISAICYCHEQQICHRDIKLENILMDDKQNIPKFIDFGFSTCIDNDQKYKMFCGTPSYMAPEIVNKMEYRGPPADIWALGVLLYVLLTGTFPFKGQTDKELYSKISSGKIYLPSSVSQEAADILDCMLTVNADKRITAKDLLNHKWIKKYNVSYSNNSSLQNDSTNNYNNSSKKEKSSSKQNKGNFEKKKNYNSFHTNTNTNNNTINTNIPTNIYKQSSNNSNSNNNGSNAMTPSNKNNNQNMQNFNNWGDILMMQKNRAQSTIGDQKIQVNNYLQQQNQNQQSSPFSTKNNTQKLNFNYDNKSPLKEQMQQQQQIVSNKPPLNSNIPQSCKNSNSNNTQFMFQCQTTKNQNQQQFVFSSNSNQRNGSKSKQKIQPQNNLIETNSNSGYKYVQNNGILGESSPSRQQYQYQQDNNNNIQQANDQQQQQNDDEYANIDQEILQKLVLKGHVQEEQKYQVLHKNHNLHQLYKKLLVEKQQHQKYPSSGQKQINNKRNPNLNLNNIDNNMNSKPINMSYGAQTCTYGNQQNSYQRNQSFVLKNNSNSNEKSSNYNYKKYNNNNNSLNNTSNTNNNIKVNQNLNYLLSKINNQQYQ